MTMNVTFALLSTHLGYASPRRKAQFKIAAAEMKRLGSTRIVQKYKSVKNVLEEGDVVYLPVHYKPNQHAGDTNLVAIVTKVLPRQKYRLMSPAGPIKRDVQRNEIMLQVNMFAVTLGIPARLFTLSPISEQHALRVMNPLENVSLYCKCKTVRVVYTVFRKFEFQFTVCLMLP
jgi:hypothetical protein